MDEPINAIYRMFVSDYIIDKLNAVVFLCLLRFWYTMVEWPTGASIWNWLSVRSAFYDPHAKKVLDGLSSRLTSTMLHLSLILSCIVAVSCLAPPGDWDRFNFAPSSRVVTPTAVHSSDGQITNPSGLIGAQGNTTFSSSGSWLALDFGVEVRCSLSSRLDRDWLLIGWRVDFTEY